MPLDKPIVIHIIRLIVIFFALLAAGGGYAQETQLSNNDNLPDPGVYNRNNFNLHFTGKYCQECHEEVPEKGGQVFLKFGGDYNKLCGCHGYTSGNYIHPVGVEPSEEKKGKIPDEFPLEDGKLSCNTCHDIYLQCQFVNSYKRDNNRFFRGGPYRSRTALCFKCHDVQKYKKLDPHTQIDADGNIIKEKCLYCHAEKPDEKTLSFKDVRLVGDIKMVCQRCHGQLEKHPANVFHFRKPSDKLLRAMNAIESVYQIILPLDHEGKLTCITCHNPHEKGVIPKERSGAKGAGEYLRHRLPKKLCKSCHGF